MMVSVGTGKERIWQAQILEQRYSAQAADSVKYFVIAGYDYGIDASIATPREIILVDPTLNHAEKRLAALRLIGITSKVRNYGKIFTKS